MIQKYEAVVRTVRSVVSYQFNTNTIRRYLYSGELNVGALKKLVCSVVGARLGLDLDPEAGGESDLPESESTEETGGVELLNSVAESKNDAHALRSKDPGFSEQEEGFTGELGTSSVARSSLDSESDSISSVSNFGSTVAPEQDTSTNAKPLSPRGPWRYPLSHGWKRRELHRVFRKRQGHGYRMRDFRSFGPHRFEPSRFGFHHFEPHLHQEFSAPHRRFKRI